MSDTNSNTPPPPKIAIEATGGPPALTGTILTDWPAPGVIGTATPGDGLVEILIDGSELGLAGFTSGSTIEALWPIGTGVHTITAVQINAAGTSAPSNGITLYEAAPAQLMNGLLTSVVDLDFQQYQSLVANGLQVDLSAPTQALQFTDGVYDLAAQSFTPATDGSASGVTTVDLNNSTGDTINLPSSAVVNLGYGTNTINAAAGASTIFASTGSAYTTLNQSGTATVLYYAAASPTQAVLLENGGSGGSTLVGAANNTMIFQNGHTGTGAMFVAAFGNETLFGAHSTSNDQYWGSFLGGSDVMFAGSGTDILVVGGGAQTLVGGAGTDVFYFINTNVVSSLTGNATAPGRYTVYNAHPGDMIALTGYDSLYGAAGSHAAAAAVTDALASGRSVVTLNDGSTISFVGNTQGLHIMSS